MPNAFEMEVDKTLAACKTLTESLVKIAAGVKTHAGNYDNACNMYYASEDHMLELKEKIKKDHGGTAGGGGAGTPHTAELKKWEANHPKLGARVKTEHTEIEKLKAGVAQAKKAEATIRTTYTKLHGGAAKSGVTDKKALEVDLKSIDTSLNAADKEIKRLDTVLIHCVNYPKDIH